jgi:membrane protein DedA with SNARE-associated domain
MSFLSQTGVADLISTYGYWAVAGVVAAESMGLPVPGEATLIAAAIVAGTTQALDIWLVVAAATAGAIIGDNIGFYLGREIGFRLMVRFASYVHLTEARIKLGQYLFLRYGGFVVFFGRFVAVLRVLAAFLAGVNCMDWTRFLLFNAMGGFVWALRGRLRSPWPSWPQSSSSGVSCFCAVMRPDCSRKPKPRCQDPCAVFAAPDPDPIRADYIVLGWRGAEPRAQDSRSRLALKTRAQKLALKKTRPRSDAATDGDRWRLICNGGPDQTPPQPSPALLRGSDSPIYPQPGGAQARQNSLR